MMIHELVVLGVSIDAIEEKAEMMGKYYVYIYSVYILYSNYKKVEISWVARFYPSIWTKCNSRKNHNRVLFE